MPTKVTNDDPTMRGQRARNEGNGQMRQKRSDTSAKNINSTYGTNFTNTATLGGLRKRYGETSIKKIIQKSRSR